MLRVRECSWRATAGGAGGSTIARGDADPGSITRRPHPRSRPYRRGWHPAGTRDAWDSSPWGPHPPSDPLDTRLKRQVCKGILTLKKAPAGFGCLRTRRANPAMHHRTYWPASALNSPDSRATLKRLMLRWAASRPLLRIALVLFVAGSSSAAAVPNRAPGDPKERFRKQDVAWAKRIDLRRNDLPIGVKWNVYGTGGGGGGGGGDVGCPGIRSDDSDLTLTGRASSLFIDTNHQYVIVSAVWILKTQAEAKRFNHRLTSGMGRCGPGLMKEQAGKIKGVRLLSFGPRRIPGTTQHWSSFRLVVSLPVHRKRLKSFVDFSLGQHGRSTAWLLVRGIPAPVPADVEAGLVQGMTGQMRHPPG